MELHYVLELGYRYKLNFTVIKMILTGLNMLLHIALVFKNGIFCGYLYHIVRCVYNKKWTEF